MREQKKLNDLIEVVLKSMRDANFADGTVKIYKHIFARLQKLASNRNDECYATDLGEAFVLDSNHPGTSEYCHSRYCLHSRCIQFIESYIKTGVVDWSTNNVKAENRLKSDELRIHKERFDSFMIERGLKPNTREGYHRLLSYFFEFIEYKGYASITQIQEGDVVAFIILVCKEHYTATSLGAHLPGLRLFLQMSESTNRFEHELPEHLPKKRDILKVYSDEEHERIINYLQKSKKSSRDKAISLLALETGIRAVDICNLKLNCIDWEHDHIHIQQEKTGKKLYIPLKASFGNAIADYLLNERPVTDSEFIFLGKNAPFKPLSGHSACYKILFNTANESDIKSEGRIYGTRITRHSIASRLLRQGIPLSVISAVLGHGNPNSAMIYLTTEDTKLANCTLPLPKGGRPHES